ncbi:MAG TPA: type VI secretion system baseplate subunit TssK [Stellaceae bacterium]
MLTDARVIPEAVQWHEGMLLSPQHFQLAARRTEALAAYLSEAAAPFCWGVQRLQIDASLLLEAVFRVVELEAVLPDGLLVIYPASDDEPRLELDLKSAEIDAQKAPVTVHVAVAARTEHASSGGLLRYRSVEGSPVIDDNTGDNEIRVPRLRPALSLHLTPSPLHPPSSKYVSLPLARIALREETFVPESYEPPRIMLARDSLLHRCARGVAVQLREKALTLGEHLQSARLQGGESHEQETARHLSAIVRTLPRLEALLQSGVAHPFPIYLTLCDVVGDIAVIGGQLNLPQLSGYEHRDALPPFTEIATYVERMLAMLREASRSIRFARHEGGRFSILMRPGWVAETLIVGARIGPGQPSDAVRDWMDSALIASSSRMRNTRENRVRGAVREIVVEVPELDLVAPPNVLLYRVIAETVAIVPEDTLEIGGFPEDPGHGQPVELLLYLPARLLGAEPSADSR